MYYVYALQSLKNRNWLYIGYSDDLKTRIKTHNDGKVKSTQFYRPLRLIYYEAYLHKTDAARREYELKHSQQQKEFLKQRTKFSLIS
ncbi:GIY-YIG nuclease family protein [Candidatus Kuenenbacteria bacterium]|nr:GIY-YIG nuclease family protein [Candidatus Kuenenbacteria bacterium]